MRAPVSYVNLDYDVTIEDIQDSLSLCFDSCCNRPVREMQQSEVMALLSDRWFDDFANHLINLMDMSTSISFLVDQEILKKNGNSNQSNLSSLVASIPDRSKLIYLLLIELMQFKLKKGTVRRDRHLVFSAAKETSINSFKFISEIYFETLEEPIQQPDRIDTTVLLNSLNSILPKLKSKWQSPGVAKQLSGLVLPRCTDKVPQTQECLKIVSQLENEYRQRITVMKTRLNVTLNSFLWSSAAQERAGDVSAILASTMISNIKPFRLSVFDIFCLKKSQLARLMTGSVSSNAVGSEIKHVRIGRVPNRGGIPEGISDKRFDQDVQKANVSMRQKDAPHPARQVFMSNTNEDDNRRGGGRGRGRGWNRPQQMYEPRQSSDFFDNRSREFNSQSSSRRQFDDIDDQQNQQRRGGGSRGGGRRAFRGSFGGRRQDNQSTDWRPSQ